MSAAGWDVSPEQEQEAGNEILNALPPDLVFKLDKERTELMQKIEKLKTFMTLDAKFKELDWKHRDLLEYQLRAMTRYEEVLVERLVLLNQPNEN